MARIITRIVVRSFGGGELVEVIQAPEPLTLKLSGYLDTYRGYFGDPLAELQLASEGRRCLVGWVFAVPADYDASELPGSTDFFELAVIPLLPDPAPERLGSLIPALWQPHVIEAKRLRKVANETGMPAVRLIDPDALDEYISVPVS